MNVEFSDMVKLRESLSSAQEENMEKLKENLRTALYGMEVGFDYSPHYHGKINKCECIIK